MTRTLLSFIVPMIAMAAAIPAESGEKIDVLIIDGQNNHNWKDTTPYLKRELEKTGLFAVEVSTTPPGGAEPPQWQAWRPDFSKYQVVLSNYNGPKWPDHVRASFEKFMSQGGGLVNVHAANNAHNGWPAFESMTGLLWRGSNHGPRLVLDDAGKEVRMPAGAGPGAGHGPQHQYQVMVRDAGHPIMKGLPAVWMHAQDELYHGQRGPAENMHILATAFSARSQGGTGMHEPMVWWIPYGKGRAVTCLLGHVDKNDSKNMPAMRCVGFLTIVQRACQWAATGKTSVPVPEKFPTADKTAVAGG